MSNYIDESNETYEDSSSIPDKDEEMSSMSEEPNGPKPLRKVLAVPELQLSQQRYLKVYRSGERTSKQKLDEAVFKSDRLRQKYDLRYADSDRVNNIFLRGHINKLKKETEERKQEQQPK